jgi:hypothetical protein
MKSNNRHSLRDGVNKVLRARPGETGFCVTVPPGSLTRGLAPAARAPGPHAFAVRVHAARHATHPRPSHSIPRSWRSRNAPLVGWNGRIKATDLGSASSNFPQIGIATNWHDGHFAHDTHAPFFLLVGQISDCTSIRLMSRARRSMRVSRMMHCRPRDPLFDARCSAWSRISGAP